MDCEAQNQDLDKMLQSKLERDMKEAASKIEAILEHYSLALEAVPRFQVTSDGTVKVATEFRFVRKAQ